VKEHPANKAAKLTRLVSTGTLTIEKKNTSLPYELTRKRLFVDLSD